MNALWDPTGSPTWGVVLLGPVYSIICLSRGCCTRRANRRPPNLGLEASASHADIPRPQAPRNAVALGIYEGDSVDPCLEDGDCYRLVARLFSFGKPRLADNAAAADIVRALVVSRPSYLPHASISAP